VAQPIRDRQTVHRQTVHCACLHATVHRAPRATVDRLPSTVSASRATVQRTRPSVLSVVKNSDVLALAPIDSEKPFAVIREPAVFF